MDSLPVVDFSLADREEKSKQITRIMETVGFLYLDNVPGYDEQELRKYTDWFHDLSMEKKMKVARKAYNPESKQIFRGYFGTNKVGSSYKEAFEVSKDLPPGDPAIETGWPYYEKSIYPQPEDDEDPKPYTDFEKFCIHYWDVMQAAALEMLRLIMMGLGYDEHFFDPSFVPKPVSTLRFINYPVHDFEIPDDAYGDDGRLLSTAAHVDTPTLTLLSIFDFEGLQVRLDNESWLDVTPRPGSLVVNLGKCLSKMTGGRVKATEHRVLAIGRPRRSVPFFLAPSFHGKLPRVLPEDTSVKSVSDCQGEMFEYGPYSIDSTTKFVEYKSLLEELKNRRKC